MSYPNFKLFSLFWLGRAEKELSILINFLLSLFLDELSPLRLLLY